MSIRQCRACWHILAQTLADVQVEQLPCSTCLPCDINKQLWAVPCLHPGRAPMPVSIFPDPGGIRLVMVHANIMPHKLTHRVLPASPGR